ncbi:NUDIX domain-containing protein [Glycomyces sp. L485]|uniref:NUDIX domain-containing protein n=1 Tax=Glycomyces sp. L485 TaxID=2909235 RepID=UPI001F4B28A6|nr:NUDIX domain-containing protein [Glycomyces sp. L485]
MVRDRSRAASPAAQGRRRDPHAGPARRASALAAAAVREVHEETGLRIDREDLHGPVAYGVYVCFPHGRLLVQKNWYFFHRVERFAPRMTAGAGYELGLGFDWLPIGALGSSDGMIEPERLVSLVKRLRDGHVPAEPVDLGGSHGPVFPGWD